MNSIFNIVFSCFTHEQVKEMDALGFNKVLEDMGKSGYGDNREYGNYGSTK